MKKLLLFTISFLAACATIPKEGTASHVIIIGLDGWTSSSLDLARLPVIKHMRENGSSTLFSESEMPTNSPTNWASMFMSVGPETHGITSEKLMNKDSKPIVHTIFSALRAQKPQSEIGAFYEWHKILWLLPKNVLDKNQHLPRMFELLMYTSVAPYIKNKKPNLLYFHIDAIDHAGHTKGFDSPDYLRTLETYDKKIGEIEEFIRKAGFYDDTVFMLVTDHGGKGLHHGGNSPEERYAPLVIYGKGIKKAYDIQAKVRIEDLAPTVAAILGFEAPSEWTGKVLKEIFE